MYPRKNWPENSSNVHSKLMRATESFFFLPWPSFWPYHHHSDLIVTILTFPSLFWPYLHYSDLTFTILTLPSLFWPCLYFILVVFRMTLCTSAQTPLSNSLVWLCVTSTPRLMPVSMTHTAPGMAASSPEFVKSGNQRKSQYIPMSVCGGMSICKSNCSIYLVLSVVAIFHVNAVWFSSTCLENWE